MHARLLFFPIWKARVKTVLWPYLLTTTLKSLINQHACLAFLEFFSTILSFFHVINGKFHLTRSLIYLVNKQAGRHFFTPYSFILVCSFIRELRVYRGVAQSIQYSFDHKMFHSWKQNLSNYRVKAFNSNISIDMNQNLSKY